MIKLAIIIPYFKLGFFDATLKSLADQSDKRFRVYIGDDASPEDCGNLLSKYSENLNFEYKRFTSNLGLHSLVHHWERCIEFSGKEEWIMILGDDDELGVNCVEEFYQNLEEINKLKIKVIRFNSEKINENTESISVIYSHPKIEKSTTFLIRTFNGKTRTSLSEYIFEKAQVQQKRFKNFPLAWHSDVFGVLDFSNFDNVFTISKAKVRVRISDKSISGMSNNYRVKNKATELFFMNILKNINHFELTNRNQIFMYAEKIYLNNKRSILYFLKIVAFYFFSLRFKNITSFIKRILISVYTKRVSNTDIF